MVRACVQGHMGRIDTWGGDSALAVLGDFCFLSGRPVPELVEKADAPILVPDGDGWAVLITELLGRRAVPFTRYATRHVPENFDYDKLKSFTKALPEGFQIAPICKGMWPVMMARSWSCDLCGNFTGGADFERRGLGFAALWEGEPVAGAASYAVCDGAIEIEIDTNPDFRRRGLATACGARLILACLDRGIYPSWDAHDRRSLSLAEKLGYQLDRPYTAYWVEEKVKRNKFLRSGPN